MQVERTQQELQMQQQPQLALEIRDFSFSYGGEQVLSHVNFQVPAGAFVVLTGRTGCGKTTLLRCCKPEIAPTGEKSGSIAVFGRALEDFDVRASATMIGYVAQSPETQIVCDSVWHEMAFGLENLGVSQQRMRRRIAEVSHFFGMEPWFRGQTASLSGGQKQLLNMASVLALRPNLLLLDEPTAQLDPVAEKDFLHAMFRVNRELGVTVVVATHLPESMQNYATHCARIEDGVIAMEPVAGGPAQAFMPDYATRADAGATGAGATGAASETGTALPANVPVAQRSPFVQLNNVYVKYDRDSDFVLRGLSCAFSAGAFHAVVGGNGCGKSTLLKVIGGALKPYKGKLKNEAPKRVGFVPQDPKALFSCDTVGEELAEWQQGAGYSQEDIAFVTRTFGLDALLAQHPYDISGGQQQLLALAKVLLCNPAVLLLDEPTKGLDTQAKLLVAQVLKLRAEQGCCIIAAMHDLSFASLIADDVLLLFDGEAAAHELAADFFADNLFYRPQDDEFSRVWPKLAAADSAASVAAADCEGGAR